MSDKAEKVTVHVPVIFYRENGKLRHEHHGAFDSMVSNRRKRRDCEYDFLSCFMVDKKDRPGFDPDSVRLNWAKMEITVMSGSLKAKSDWECSVQARPSTATPKSVELV